ncbi:MAG: fibronectin type III domain-containing protein, partial [Acidimicrobiaceae bacterium]|nr:fibronectin type III domain-containing protein [Acidimicrobiaceae bacterium]
VLAASVLAVLPAGRADAQTAHTFVANTGQADGGSAALGNDYAQAFTTGSNSAGYSLRSVDAEFSAVDSGFSPSALTASIHADSGGSPGSSLGTLTSPASFPVSASDQTLTFTSAGIDLEASTTYFLVIDMGSAHAVSGLRSTASDSEDSGASAGWSIGDSVLTRGFSSTGSWTTNAPSLKVSLGGVATETEPPNFVGNLGQGDGGSSFLGNDFAQAFTTGDYSFGYYLLSVRVQFSNIASGFDASALTASIHASSGGSPGSSLGELVSPESFPESASDQTLTFTSAGIDLEASTTYFLVIDMGAGQGSSRISLTASDSEDSGGSAGWSIGDGALTRTASSTGAWTPNTSSLVVGLDGVDRTPRVGITGGGAVTEGASASFTLTASPAPAADLPVDVSVTTSGDFGFGALPTRVTIPTSGTATLTVATTGDDVDESDGSVTVSLVEGRDYDLATALETATVAVRDDDPPLVANTGKAQSAFDSLAFDHAQAFTTGGNPPGYILTGVDVVFHQISDSAIGSKLAVTVNRDNGGVPGATVATLTNPGTIVGGTNGFTHSGVSLAADTKYWVVVDGSSSISGANFVSVTASNAEDAGAAIGWSIADESYQNSSGSWQVLGQSGKLRIGVSGRLLPNSDGSFTVPFDWPLKPPGVGGGDAFRLMFMTEDHRDATSADIDVYDAHVREAAREGHAAIRRYADKFRVVGSTSEVDARDHTRTNRNNAAHTDVPIWWLNGQRIAPGNAVFWSDTWENWAMADRRFASGETSTSNDWPWTGTRTDGRKEANPLGASNARRGRFSTTDADTGPISYNTTASTQDHAFYGMSPLFRVEPTPVNAPPGEPAVMSNLGQADGAALTVTAASAVRDRAQSFTTGRNGGHYRLNSVDVEFAEIGDADAARDLRVQIWAGSGGSPGSTAADVLADLARPSMPVGSADRTFTFTYQGDDGSGLQLEPNTTYWVYVYDASVQPNSTYTLRATASNSERLQGLRLPEGWSIGDDSLRRPVTTSSWSTNSEALKIGLNLGAADHFVQFRTCEGVVSGNDCSTGWVIANYTRHDPPPTITLVEGGPVVTYQWQAVDPKMRRYHYVEDQVTKPRSHIGGRIGAGNPDRDRLMCHTGISSIYNRGVYNVGDPIVDGLERTVVNGLGLEQTTKFGYGSTAGSLLDRHDGCPFAMQSVYENDPNKWRPVSVAAGQDSDAFDHRTFLIHSPRSGFDYPEVHVPLVIHDDDEWEQTLEFSIDDGATWTSIEDSGLSAAFPRSLHTGRKAHYFWVRLKHDPETLGGQASQTKRISVSADFPKAPLLSGTSAYFRSYRVWFTSPAASNRHTFRGHQFTSSFGSVTVSRTPVQVEINVGANVTGNVAFQVDARDLYERSDNEISTETPPKTVRTDSFDFYRRLGSCVGCQRLLGDLPDPVVERVGDLSFANLSDTGIDLSWPRVVGAEGYEARWWSTTSPFSGVPAEDAWFGAEPTDPAWGIRHLEPDTEYRAVVYYQDHGATQLSTASPVIRFTTLAAGAPVQVDPASVVVERVPEASISAAPGTITEGDDAVFTVTLDPAPDAPLDVRVHVTAPSAGSVVDGQHVGERTVNVPTAGSASFTIPTVYDPSPTSNGMLGATVDFGEGYRLSKFNSYASVYVANNDLPPPPPVQLKAVSDTTATVAWKPQGDGTTYRVAWHKAYSGIPVMTEVTTTATEYQLTGLDPRSNYTVSVLVGSRQIGKLSVKTLAAGATPKTFTVDFDPPSTELPVISVTADGDVTEGEDATFTVTANPAPAADLDVSVTVSQSGDYGAITGHTEQRTVTIPAAGYVTLTVATANDEADEADGSVTVTVDAGASLDYRVSSSQGTAVVVVADDDGDHTVNQGTIARVKELASQTQHGTAHVNRWNRVLLAFGEHDGTDVTGGPMTASEAQDMADRHSSNVWDLVVVELTALEAATAPTPPPPTPEVSVTASSGITEGGDATFTVTASPAPAADLAVSVTVSQSGDYGAATGQRTVTVPTSGSVTLTVGTTDDTTDET